MIVCDTGPLVAAALSKDPDHRRCVDLFTDLHLANRPMVLPAPVVAEVTYLIGSRAGAAAESAFLISLAEGDFIPVELTSTDYGGWLSWWSATLICPSAPAMPL